MSEQPQNQQPAAKEEKPKSTSRLERAGFLRNEVAASKRAVEIISDINQFISSREDIRGSDVQKMASALNWLKSMKQSLKDNAANFEKMATEIEQKAAAEKNDQASAPANPEQKKPELAVK